MDFLVIRKVITIKQIEKVKSKIFKFFGIFDWLGFLGFSLLIHLFNFMVFVVTIALDKATRGSWLDVRPLILEKEWLHAL